MEAAVFISKCLQVFSLESFIFQTLICKSEGIRQLERPRHKLQDNTERDTKETGCEELERIKLPYNKSSGGLLGT
jgi:hypothetical protein